MPNTKLKDDIIRIIRALVPGMIKDIGGSAIVGGSNTQVQYNDGGTLAGASGMAWNKTTKTLTLSGTSGLTYNIQGVSDGSDVGLSLLGGDADGTDVNGGLIALVGGNGDGAGAGGSSAFNGGTGGATGNGGPVSLAGGAGGATSGNGGDCTITAGSAVTDGAGGTFVATGGNAAGNNDGGDAGCIGGNGSGSGGGGDGALIAGNGGDTGNGGQVELAGGTGGITSGNGGETQVKGGDAWAGNGGNVSISAGFATVGNGGSVSIDAGSSGSGDGGSVNVAPGAGADGGADGVITLGDGGATDYTQFDITGHQTMVGDAQPWDDLRIEPVARTTGSNAPTFEKWLDDSAGTSRGVYLYSFDDANAGSEKEVHFTMQMPHSWNGGDIHVHVHWIGAVDDTTAEPRWGLEYAWKEIDAVFGDTTIIYAATKYPTDANVTALKHYLTEFAAISPGSTADGLSSILIGRLFRDSANAGDTYNATGAKCGLLYIDAHYQLNSLGSTDELTK